MSNIIKQFKIHWKLLVLIVFLIILYIIFNFFNMDEYISINFLQDTISSFGVFGPLVYIIIMAVAIVISPIPSLPITISSGFIWGIFLGTLYSVIGATIGATISFLIARKLGKQSIYKLLGKYAIFCGRCTEKSLFLIILFARLIPFFQFDIVSYGAGLTKMPLWKFILATIIGMIPTTFLFVKFGSSLAIDSWISILFSLLLIIGIFVLPIIFKKKFQKYIKEAI